MATASSTRREPHHGHVRSLTSARPEALLAPPAARGARPLTRPALAEVDALTITAANCPRLQEGRPAALELRSRADRALGTARGPCRRTHAVHRGKTLSAFAARCRVGWRVPWALNRGPGDSGYWFPRG